MNFKSTLFASVVAIAETIIPACFSIPKANIQLRKIFAVLLLSPMLVVVICSQSSAQGKDIYNNGTSIHQFVPIGQIPPFDLKPPQEVMDWDSSGGGTVTWFQFGYYTPAQDSFGMTIRFYTRTSVDSNGTMIAQFPFTGLPSTDMEHFINHNIAPDEIFELPPGLFGYSYELLDSLGGPIFSTGEKGSDSLRSVSQNKNFVLGTQNQLHMILRGLLTTDHTFDGPGVIQAGAVATYDFKISAPLPPPPDPFINMEGFIGIKTDDPGINFFLSDGSMLGITPIDSNTTPDEKERLSDKFGRDPINFCSEGVWKCTNIEFGNGFTFETEIFVDGFETGDISSWATGAAADSTANSPKEKPVGVINEDKKLPVITAEELAEAIKLFNEDDLFDEKTIGLVSDSFGVLQQLPPHRGQYFFDEFESFRKSAGQPPVTIDGIDCPSPCSGLILQGGNSGINGIRFINFPDYGVVLESDSNFVTNSEFNTNGAGGLQIIGNGNRVGDTEEDANSISNNGGPGVVVESGTENAILFNTFSNNGGLAIDLAGDGITANDAGDSDSGANNLQNYPVLTNVRLQLQGRGPFIEGTLNSTASASFSLQFYKNGSCDPSGNGEGEALLGSADVATDGNGDAAFSVTAAGSAEIGQSVSATATDAAGNTSEFSACYEITTTVSVSSGIELPTEFALYENYPNPFNPTTTIKYELPEATEISLIIYNLQGQSVRTLVSTSLPAGSYTVDWDGRNDKGMQMSSGAYLLKIEAGSFIKTRKMMLMK